MIRMLLLLLVVVAKKAHLLSRHYCFYRCRPPPRFLVVVVVVVVHSHCKNNSCVGFHAIARRGFFLLLSVVVFANENKVFAPQQPEPHSLDMREQRKIVEIVDIICIVRP